jgi:signal transduction histidine kinase/CheY-like chemotaxis protein
MMARDTRHDRIARLAAGLFDAPIAGLCLAEGDDLRLAAAVGAGTPAVERGLVAWGRRALREGLVVQPDLRAQPSPGEPIPAAANPAFRFVAATPLRAADGTWLGALCVADSLPRPDLDAHGRTLLDDLAELAVEGLARDAGADGGEEVARERAGREAAERSAAEAGRRLEQEQRTRARFLAAANHDLRQPFQALHLFLHLLQGKLTEPGQRDLADRIEQAVRNGEAMLTGLLDLSALEMGRTRVSIGRFRLADLLARLIEEFEPQTQARGIRLRFVPTEVEVETDATLVERTLRHLMSNAVHHARAGGVLVGVRRRGDRAAVEVWDTGPGIPADDHRRIFEPFEQVIEPQMDRSGRLGLGLAIVDRTARLLGLGVEVASRPGRGSVFRLLVPRVLPAPAPEEPEPPRPQPATVVVIEDDPVQLMAVRMILEGWGLSVVAAPTRERVMLALGQSGERPGLVISDLRLRGTENGLDAVAALRAGAGAVPAILMTGDTSPDQVRAAESADILLLRKPFGPEHLRGAIERVTGWQISSTG